jgi:urease accessory protein
MREVKAIVNEGAASVTVTLTYDQRCKSRQRLRLDDDSEAALLLERGTVLPDGALLAADDGTVIAVKAAPETLSVVRTEDPLALARAAYHLGNRHVPLQIRGGELSYQHDHVLDDMIASLGLMVSVVRAPFHPEGGAYGRGHTHGHGGHSDHDHDHGHGHDP